MDPEELHKLLKDVLRALTYEPRTRFQWSGDAIVERAATRERLRCIIRDLEFEMQARDEMVTR